MPPNAVRRSLSSMGTKKNLVVTSKTDVVIEGFPRSGNTFAVLAFLFAQKDPASLSIGHHLHVPAQLLLAQRYRIPTMVIIRAPGEAIPSLLVRESHVNVRAALARYLSFHRGIHKCRTNLLLVRFESVIEDFGDVLAQFNKRFSTSYNTFPHTQANVAAVFEQIESLEREKASNEIREDMVSRPSEIRRAQTDSIRMALEHPDVKAQYAECVDIYLTLLQTADC